MAIQTRRKLLVSILVLVVAFAYIPEAQAARGVPGSDDFGFGAALYPSQPLSPEAVAAAVDLGLDWIYIPLAWEDYQPVAGATPKFTGLDQVVRQAEQNQIAVAVSITQAPDWALTPNGPDPITTVEFIRGLINLYPTAIQAIELFPGANTLYGWGSQPNPQDYFALFQQVNEMLLQEGSSILLVAAGLQPLSEASSKQDLDDLTFLDALYQLGAASIMQVISLQFPSTAADPLALPYESNVPVLRHYETVREVMVKNQHRNGLIWITHLNLPSGKISISHSMESDLDAQAVWLSQVYLQLRAQLYIGVAFLQSLNPEPEGSAAQIPSLVSSDGETNPFYGLLRDMIGFNKTGNLTTMPGKPKDGSLEKKRP